MVAFPEPTRPADRAQVLVGYLDFFRDRAVGKLRTLTPEGLRHSAVPSGWSPAELLHHLLWVERRWIEWGFLGRDVGDPWGDEVDGRWRLPAGLDLDGLVAALDAQAGRTREVAGTHDLDEVGAPGPSWRGAEPATLERVLLHLVQEWARHLGHLDIVVELSAGSAGE